MVESRHFGCLALWSAALDTGEATPEMDFRPPQEHPRGAHCVMKSSLSSNRMTEPNQWWLYPGLCEQIWASNPDPRTTLYKIPCNEKVHSGWRKSWSYRPRNSVTIIGVRMISWSIFHTESRSMAGVLCSKIDTNWRPRYNKQRRNSLYEEFIFFGIRNSSQCYLCAL